MKNSLLVIALLFSAIACNKKHDVIVAGVTEKLAAQRKSVISDLEYQLSFSIPAKQSAAISGEVLIRLDLKNTNNDLQLDFKGDSTVIYKVSTNGDNENVKLTKGHLVVPKSALKTGTNQIKLGFTSPDWSLNRNPEFLYTLFVPDRASTAFPCFDQPDLKARFSLKLQIPAAWKAVANGPVASEQLTDSVKILNFKTTQPLPTYLFAFTAGKFDTISRTQNGRTCVMYHREKAEELQNNADSIFTLVFNSLKWIENYTQIPYPFEKYDLVAIPSFQYSGMEHPGATFYKASTLFPEKNPTQQQLLRRANLIAHETAHMWFGDLVTMKWFNEVWMKEVFANFIADKVVTPMFPQFNFDLQFLMAHYDVAYSVDRTTGANPIEQKLTNMKDAGSLYGAIIYHKAPIVMRMLEEKIGEQQLQLGLQQYLAQYKYGNAGWNDLISILDKNNTNKLANWSDIWVNEAGRPTLKAKAEGSALVIEQTDPAGKSRVWSQQIEVVYPSKEQLKNISIVLDKNTTRVENTDATAPEWIYPNAKGKTYGFVELDSKTATFFLSNFGKLKDDVLRASVLTDLAENMHEGKIQSGELLRMLLNELTLEKNSVIFEKMLSTLEFCFIYKSSSDEQKSIQETVENALWREYPLRKNQQTAVINSLIRIAASKESLSKLEDCIDHPEKHPDIRLSADQQTELAYQLALKQPSQATNILDAQENRISNADKKVQFQFVRQSLNPSKTERDRFFNSLLQAENREHEPWVEQALGFLNHPLRQNEALNYIRPALDKLQEIQQTGDIFFPKNWLDNLLKGHSSKEAASIVKQFLREHPDYPESLKLKILQTADHLLRL